MKEIKNRQLVQSYLQAHQLESIFNDDIMPYLSLYHFEQGELILSQGEPSKYLYVLVQGKIKIYTTSAQGKTLILSFKTPIEVIGDIEYVQEIDTINTVEAVSSVYMIGVQHTLLKKLTNDYSPFLQFMLTIITEKFYLKNNSMSFNLMHPVEVRLASYLLSVIHDENESILSGQLSTSSLADTANLIGTSYRHLNRVIRQFCSDGLVERKKGFILIKDREALTTLSGGNIYE
ncbi:cyclic nucleotide-binding domain-containing protein [Neobacillus niacini]|uniref:Crp/Fnr family transcriptional regulator n=1 Tax=Neobacillus niacini TaxID=86668 RepID=UPI00052F5C74|nr:cyclic nucleotide-binding domain-containing protein [Neobacillus niacini]KGM45621.1 Crp/Fnr family transcriptional regulator [Neobacillus niacini]MEC1525523.1 cyclic nucleotide-binding domain-containing protein [Neobacillus niacini]